jgi:hypothetical protein
VLECCPIFPLEPVNVSLGSEPNPTTYWTHRDAVSRRNRLPLELTSPWVHQECHNACMPHNFRLLKARVSLEGPKNPYSTRGIRFCNKKAVTPRHSSAIIQGTPHPPLQAHLLWPHNWGTIGQPPLNHPTPTWAGLQHHVLIGLQPSNHILPHGAPAKVEGVEAPRVVANVHAHHVGIGWRPNIGPKDHPTSHLPLVGLHA